MKIEIEISEEDAACVWMDLWGDKKQISVKQAVEALVENQAALYRRTDFAEAGTRAVELLRKMNSQIADA